MFNSRRPAKIVLCYNFDCFILWFTASPAPELPFVSRQFAIFVPVHCVYRTTVYRLHFTFRILIVSWRRTIMFNWISWKQVKGNNSSIVSLILFWLLEEGLNIFQNNNKYLNSYLFFISINLLIIEECVCIMVFTIYFYLSFYEYTYNIISE